MFESLKSLFGDKAKPTSGPQGSGSAATFARFKRVNLSKRFQIIRETTSQGSMSKVFQARDLDHGRTVCLKVQNLAKTTAAHARAAGGGANGGRITEGEIIQKIQHPNVVRVLDFGISNQGEYFLAMEYIEGLLLPLARDLRTPSLNDRIEWLAQAAEALAAVHAAGFIHHDFGPRNLMATPDGQVKLIDFGLAVPNTPEFRRPGNRTGTIQYLAPEVIRREPKDERLDIFAWGVTAFELLSGRLPYDTVADPMAQMRLRINCDPLELARVAPHVPAELRAIVDKTLTRGKETRWPKAATLATALRGLTVVVH